MGMKFISLLIIFILFCGPTYADDVCSRTATINYQDVLVDTSSSKLGEGLRFYLDKDPEAKKLLDKYQENNKIRRLDAVVSTAGSGMIIFGLFQSSKQDSSKFLNRESLIYSGIGLILLSYLVSRTIQYNNEKYLIRSIDEYNKRNTPRIYFNPTSQTDVLGTTKYGLVAGLFKDF